MEHAPELERIIEAFEAAQEGGPADPAAFLPSRSDPLYLPAVRELVRVDLEYCWQRGRPRPLDDYRSDFPELFADAEGLRDAAFEEYRLRCQAGQRPDPAEYARRYGVPTAGWPPPSDPDPADSLAQAARSYQALASGSAPGPALTAWAESLPGPEHARLLLDLHCSDPGAAARLARAVTAFPEPGDTFAGFRLVSELGRGAFGRVYLARQDDLAGRLVALKVVPDPFDESATLAQLQHTHIVPVYSVHRRSPFRAVCMPFFGATTLADVLRGLNVRPSLPTLGKDLLSTVNGSSIVRSSPLAPRVTAGGDAPVTPETLAQPGLPLHHLDKLSYVEAVLWLGARLADGLAHAHDRGILHRDLKPANVLITDEGQPMLLDFNLAQDTKLRGTAVAAQVGGTLPYMAPEQLEVFGGAAVALDGRCDVYSLGLILFELLAGRPPFPLHRGEVRKVVERMIADRWQPPPLRPLNPAVSPAAEAIVRRCLEADRDRRYQSARQLQEDLERQFAHLPLKHTPEPSPRERLAKWVRRHPQLTSVGGVAALTTGLALVLLVVVAAWGWRLRRFEAAEQLGEFHRDVRAVQFRLMNSRVAEPGRLAESAAACRDLLGRYHVLDDDGWADNPLLTAEERGRLRSDVGRLAALWATAEDDPSRREEARRLLGTPPPANARLAEGHYADALPLLEEAARRAPDDVWNWFALGLCHEALFRDADAAACFGTCVALAPDFAPFSLKRATALIRLGRHRDALGDLDAAIARQPDLAEAWLNRARARAALGQVREAVADLDRARELDGDAPVVLLYRAALRAKLGDAAGAARDRKEGLSRTPADELGWVARAQVRMADDPAGALADLDEALKVNPRSWPALQNRAHVLSERLGRTDAAVVTLDRLLEAAPQFVPARAGRAVLLARLGRRAEAHRDAAACLAADAGGEVLYQAACAYALTSRDHPDDACEALALLWLALRRGYGRGLLATDPDLEPLRETQEFARLLAPSAKPGATP